MPSIIAYSGIVRLSRRDLEKLKEERQKMCIQMVGILIVAKDVPPKLAQETIGCATVQGMVCASKGVKRVLANR